MNLQNCHLIVAPLTPMNEVGEVDLNLLEDQADLLLSRGAQGFYILGSTGEGMLLTHAERVAVAERWRAILSPEIPLLVHVGHGSIEEARSLARHASQIEVSAISSVGPTHYTCSNLQTLVNWSASIAAAAPELPFFHYFLGSTPTTHPARASEYLAEAIKRIPTLGGIKYTHEDLLDYGDCLRLAGSRYRVFYGKDEAMLAALSLGAPAFVGGTYNLFSPLAVKILNAYQSGDQHAARQAQETLQQCIGVLRRYGGLVALKAAMSSLGINLGQPRLPLRGLTDQNAVKLIAELEQVWPQMTGAAGGTVRLISR
ncbi:MAG: dihydrodipicolinate synthase family protein [Phycisphaeraceae bacterium]